MNEECNNQYCPECGKLTMKLVQSDMICSSCNANIPIDVYLMSIQMVEKDLVVQLLKLFLQAGTGRCVNYNGSNFVVGFNQNYDLITQKYNLQEGEENGMYVQINTGTEE